MSEFSNSETEISPESEIKRDLDAIKHLLVLWVSGDEVSGEISSPAREKYLEEGPEAAWAIIRKGLEKLEKRGDE